MSGQIFTKTEYSLSQLVERIHRSDIRLPDIQRGFVWKNTKARDLFDSIYKGYPVGYFLFLKSAQQKAGRTIGAKGEGKSVSLLVLDGQQRLTSLYAVMRSVPIPRANFKTEPIEIAFNPLAERFEVVDAAIRQNKWFIPNISILWDEDARITKIIREYIDGLKREVTEQEEKNIEGAIEKLKGLTSFTFTALELASDISEENASDIFIRINSQGTPLGQADFILTRMSVFWSEGRSELERFCHDAHTLPRGKESPSNSFIKPAPEQLLRVGIGVGFKRAKLKYVYSILLGKDLETREVDTARRKEQFEVLKTAQEKTLNLEYWHGFMDCIWQGGFRSNEMISSVNNLLFSYMLYLIGRTEYKVKEPALTRIIARWFFMSAVSSRFTSSSYTAMESDLARLRSVHTPDDFLKTLTQICEITLTNDLWSVSLPNALATSASRGPSLCAYQAALVLLDAPAFFSTSKLTTLLDPAGSTRGAIKHRLFPMQYLKQQGVTDFRSINQIANCVLMEKVDNPITIDTQAPAEYLPKLREQFGQAGHERMNELHALPPDWENMEYQDFLEKRRELMAKVTKKGYETLVRGKEETSKADDIDLSMIVAEGESDTTEFKSSLRFNLHTGKKDPRIEMAVLKTLASFLNTHGGKLIIGVADDGEPVWHAQDGDPPDQDVAASSISSARGVLAVDRFESEDKMSRHLVNIVNANLTPNAMVNIHSHFDDLKGEKVMEVTCRKSPTPVFCNDICDSKGAERFYIRTGPTTVALKPSQIQAYTRQRFDN